MSYTKQTWATGDTITAEKLNHMEDGIHDAATPELPAVSGNDDGKFLQVVNGEWHAEDAIFVLHGTLTSETTGTISESASDLLIAANNKQRIMLEFTMDSHTINLELGFRYFDDTSITADGFFYYENSDTAFLVKITVTDVNSGDDDALLMYADYFVLTPVSA